jgi:hypothetical protein
MKNERTAIQSYCPRCRVTTYYPPNRPHFRWCDEILQPLDGSGRVIVGGEHYELKPV